MKNILIFDAGFVTALSRKLANGALDLKKLKSFLESKYGKINRTYFVTAINTEEQRNFHSWLQHELKAEIVAKSVKGKQCQHCGNVNTVEKGIDVALAVLAIKFAGHYDRLIFVNGDGDLVDAIRHVRDDLRKQIVVVGEPNSVSGELLLHSDEFVDIGDFAVLTTLLKS
jgi:uncharacterized LabA/DUF88 family protein